MFSLMLIRRRFLFIDTPDFSLLLMLLPYAITRRFTLSPYAATCLFTIMPLFRYAITITLLMLP